MPGYQTHIGWSSVAGVGLASAAHLIYDVSLPQSAFAGALCALGGVLPDVDSESSRSFQRCLSTIAGVFSLVLASRLRDFSLTAESVVMIGATAYFLIFYVGGKIVKACTVHRGMCHSLVFGLIAAEIVFILSSGDTQLRLFKAAAIFFGVLVHLTLDEVYSVETSGKRAGRSRSGGRTIYLKNSFGTALKLIDYKHMQSTIAFYVAALLLGNCALNVQSALARFENADQRKALQGKAAVDRVRLIYPTQFELSAVQWVAENGFVLEPGSADNPNWAELEALLALGKNRDDKNANAENAAEETSAPEIVDETGRRRPVSLLDVVNWNSRNSTEPDAATFEARP
ncbi:MAG: metal-dependent hydrolase [Thermoguttaceae bacterium]|nr:metal-dependent hydrolase [Thermoguttaceae bacterium]MBQ9800354.1 metal-dependent hydrolase [Thermoguttaceae bacterium]